MWDSIKKIALLCLVFFIALGMSFLCGFLCGKTSHIEPLEEKVDTLFIHDTITQIEPISVERKVVERVLVPVVDTMRIHDTLKVYLDREQVRWEDSLAVVYASGVGVQVDSVTHHTSQMVITKEVRVPVVKRTHWGLGVQAGGGVAYSGGKVVASPYIGIGINYNIISW